MRCLRFLTLVALAAGAVATGCSARSAELAADAGGAPGDAGESPDVVLRSDASGGADSSAATDAGEAQDGHTGDTWVATDAPSVSDASTEPPIEAGPPPDAGPPADAGPPPDCDPDAGEPSELACTGLYADWATRTLAPGVRPYTPAYTLWSDGAEKQRWIQLPPGTQIDTSDMDQWTFPVGTKVWKQFALNGQLVETRFLWKQPSGNWLYTTYAWSADQSSATELTTGETNWNGTSYEIPSQARCQDCHAGRLDFVLGFEAVGLSAPGATGLTMQELVAENLVTQPPAAPIVVPGDAATSAALGWLHANCGNACHNDTSYDCNTTLFLKLSTARMGSVEATDTWTTAVGQPLVSYSPPWPMLRITPGSPTGSAVYYRASVRDTDPSSNDQMPPYDSHVVPDAGAALLSAWIASMPADAGAASDGG